MELPIGTRGKITAVGLLLLLIGVVTLPFRPLWDRLNGIEEERETVSTQLRKFSRLASQLPQLKRRLADMGSSQPMDRYLLQGNTPSLAAAELQRIMHRTIGQHKGKITSAKILPGTMEKGFELVPVSIQLDITLAGLQALLYDIETMKPRLFIDQLRIMSNQQTARHSNINRPNKNELKVTLTLHGIRSNSK